MAWPCISRVCCLARFWDQFDKSDLSVPLTIQNYSDIPENEVRSVTKQVTASTRAPSNDYSSLPRASGTTAHADAPGPRSSLRTQREPSYKPREEYSPSVIPFPSVTQYKQDYKPWPIPRKDNFPWISNGTRDERVPRQQPTEPSPTSSYRQEYRPWTGAKPAKSSKKNFPVNCATPGTESTHVAPKTSYQAAYSGDSLGTAETSQVDSALPSASSNVQTASFYNSSSTQHSALPEKEEHLVRTKLPPNPSAVFQGGSRTFHI